MLGKKFCKSGEKSLAKNTIISDGPLKGYISILEQDPCEYFGVRPELIEDMVRVLRVAVGNLPNAEDGMTILSRRLRKLHEMGYDVTKFTSALEQVISRKVSVIGEKEVQEISQNSNLPIYIMADLVLCLSEALNRGLDFLTKVDKKTWDGVEPLSALFNAEIVSKDSSVLLDQRFLDYLAVNTEKLDKIHWRNFERLCAEFFDRSGYYVQLGPGVADGGVDIRVWPAHDDCGGPPLMLVQCKRYKKGNQIGIEYVKAFWTDVDFERAERGMIVTTSTFAPGGKKICEARKWPLSLVEGQQVKNWTKSMWRYRWEDQKEVENIGRYMLQPVVPFIQKDK